MHRRLCQPEFHAIVLNEESESESFFVSLTRNRCVWPQSGSSFEQELFDDLVSAVALTEFHQARKMEFHSGFDFARRDVVAARFQTLRQFFRAAEYPQKKLSFG